MGTWSAPDPDFERRTRESFGAQAAMREFGVAIEELTAGRVVLGLRHDPRFTQQHGYLHAGVLATVMDSACGYAAFTLMHPDAAVLTVEYKVNLMRPAAADAYRVRGEVVRAGRTLTVAQATAFGVGDDEPIAVMTGTLMSLVGANIRH